MSVNNYQLIESDISEDLDLPQHRRQNANSQTALPHSLLQTVCDLCSEPDRMIQFAICKLSCEYQEFAGYLFCFILITAAE